MDSAPQPKLRLSCDECLAAKVKCDKQHPTCHRCAATGLSCLYSPSRKFGRPPAARKHVHPAATPSISPRPSSVPRHAAPALLYMGSETLSGHATSVGSDSGIFLPDWVDFSGSPHDHSHASQLGLGGENSLHDFNAADLLPPADFTDHAHLRRPSSGRQDDGTAHDEAGGRPKSPSHHHPSHDCQYRAYCALSSLHHRTRSRLQLPGLPGAAPLSGPGTSSDLAYGLDKILHVNKAVVNVLLDLLECPCAREHHLAFLYASIVSRVMFWYRTGVALLLPKTAAGGGSDDRTSSACQPQAARLTAGACPGSIAQHPPDPEPAMTTIQVGSFNLDRTDQIMLYRQLLLSEARKVGAVIEKMSAMAGQADPQLGDLDEPDDVSPYLTASMTLRNELQETLKKVRESAKDMT